MPRRAAATNLQGTTQVIVTPPSQTPPPIMPASVEDSVDVWTYMKNAPTDEWGKSLIAYLYRDEPKVSMIGGGSGGFLAKFTQPFDVDDVKRVYGGRRFTVLLKGEGGKIVKSQTFSIEAAPIYDMREVAPGATAAAAAAPDRSFEEKVLQILEREMNRNREANGSGMGNEKTIDMMVRAADRAVELVKGQVPTGVDAAKQLESLVVTMKNLGFNGAAPSGGGISESILKILVERALTPVDPMAQLTAFFGIYEKMQGLAGNGKGSGSDWKDVAMGVLQNLPAVLQTVNDARGAAPAGVSPTMISRGPVPAGARAVNPPQFTAPGHVNPSGLPTVPLSGEDAQQPAAVAEGQQPPATAETASIAANPNYQQAVLIRMVEMVREAGAEADEFPDDRTDVLKDAAEKIVDFLDSGIPGMSKSLVDHPADMVTGWLRSNDPIMREAVDMPCWPQLFEAARKYILENIETPDAKPS